MKTLAFRNVIFNVTTCRRCLRKHKTGANFCPYCGHQARPSRLIKRMLERRVKRIVRRKTC